MRTWFCPVFSISIGPLNSRTKIVFDRIKKASEKKKMGILFVDDGDFFERSFYQDLIQLVSIYSFLTESNAQKAFELARHLSVHEMWPS